MKTILSWRRHHYAAEIRILLAVLAIGTLMAGMVGCGGSGSAIRIRTWYDLNDIRDVMNGNYVLMNDLDFTTAGYEELASPAANGGKGWEPIGGHEWGNVFWGTFDGNGYKICDLFINRPDEIDVALFGTVGQGVIMKGVVRNVGVVNFTVTGNANVAGLVGGSFEAFTVSNCYATGNVTGDYSVGGLMGTTVMGATVTNSYSTGSVTGNSSVGGLTGRHWGAMVNCHATGNVTGGGEVGGLVGSSSGNVSDCYATGTVTGGGQVGGLVGLGEGLITNSYCTGNVAGYGVVGGLLGLGYNTSTVINCYATGNVTDTGYGYVGGLVGSTDGTVTDSYATGSVNGSDFVGGLVGIAHTVSNCHATGNVTGDEVIGGLVGWHSDGAVSHSYATGSVNGNYSGGLVGVNGKNWVSGGLVELNDNGGVAIYCSYSAGSVTGGDCIGGLVGENYLGAVSDSYSCAGVTGGSRVGGLVGWNAGNVTDSYSTGSVTGNSSVGGLLGEDEGTVNSSFWDTETSGQATSDGGTGKNTTEMHDIDTFSGAAWNITAVGTPGDRNPAYIWNIVDDVTYAFLSWQP